MLDVCFRLMNKTCMCMVSDDNLCYWKLNSKTSELPKVRIACGKKQSASEAWDEKVHDPPRANEVSLQKI